MSCKGNCNCGSKWQPMSTAPRDGSEILICVLRYGVAALFHVAYDQDGGENGAWVPCGLGLSGPDFHRECEIPSGEPPLFKYRIVSWMPLPTLPKKETITCAS